MNFSPRRLATLVGASAAALATLLVLTALPQDAGPQLPSGEVVFGIDSAESKVHWTLGTTLHTVHGSFAMKKGALRLDPETGKAGGEIVVDTLSGNSGNDSRDKKMHKDVLESGRYPEIVFRPDRIEGKIASQGTFMVQVHGLLSLHGSEHELSVPVQAELAGNHWSGSTKFSVPFIDWGLKNPSNFFLKVNHSVDIELELKGSLENPLAP